MDQLESSIGKLLPRKLQSSLINRDDLFDEESKTCGGSQLLFTMKNIENNCISDYLFISNQIEQFPMNNFLIEHC